MSEFKVDEISFILVYLILLSEVMLINLNYYIRFTYRNTIYTYEIITFISDQERTVFFTFCRSWEEWERRLEEISREGLKIQSTDR